MPLPFVIRRAIQGLIGLGLLGIAAVDAAAPPPQALSFGGPIIPGLCVIDQLAIFNSSKVGGFANAHFQQMRDSAQKSISAEEAQIAGDAKALKAQKLPQQQLQQREQTLAKRYADLRAKAADDSKSLETARQSMAQKIAAAAQPVIKQVYGAHRCGLLLARGAVLAGNSGMDVTSDVVRGLDARLTTIPLDQKVPASTRH